MNHAAIAQAIERRAAEIGRPWAEVGRRATNAKGEAMDSSTVWHARSYGQQGKNAHAVSAETLRRLDRGLDWPEGTLERIGNGAPYPEPQPTPPEKVEALERHVTELRGDLVALRDQLDQLADTVRQLADALGQRR